MILLTDEAIDAASLIACVAKPECGGVVLFLGTVRELTGDKITTHLEYEAHAAMAEKEMEMIAAEARSRWPIGGLAVVHRLGRLAVGDIAVGVAVSCPHRGDAFEANRFIIDRIKQRVPIWKKEHGPEGNSNWVHGETEPPSFAG